MATSYYSTGSITLENGSAVVTGVGTAWQTNLITNGYILVEAAEGNVLPILSVDSNAQITAELEWQGADGTYSYVIMRNPDQLQDNAENSRNLVALLNEIRNGLAFKYDQSGTLADRALFDGRPKGFAYLVIGGATADLYVKRSNASGDWAGPYAYGTGPQGIQGPAGYANPRGTYAPAVAYARNDAVLYNGSSFVALQPTTGNAPPTLPTTANAFWQLIAVKGQDGAGTGDMVGPANAVDGRLALFSGTTGKLLRQFVPADAAAVRTLLGAQAALGFEPVQRGGGAGQLATYPVYLGLNTAGNALKAQVGTSDLGRVITDSLFAATLGDSALTRSPTPAGDVIQQMGYYAGGGDTTIVFPQAFPNKCIIFVPVVYDEVVRDGSVTVYISAKTPTGVTVRPRYINPGGSGGGATQGFHWLAIGY